MNSQRETVLVVGGAGYIGSHTARALADTYEVVVFDDLSRGHRWAVQWGDFVEGKLHERERLVELLERRQIKAVFHFAASSLVGESVTAPLQYWENNCGGTQSLLSAMKQAGTKYLVFSSTAAVYGEPKQVPITEDVGLDPTNPYGQTKLAVEWMLANCAQAFGLQYAALRYFNAAGASPAGDIGEDHSPETHLIPLVLDAAMGRREGIKIFGDDYPTPDGTCVRDYIHVCDLADAHVSAFEHLRAGTGSLTINLGNGQGYSVRQVVDTVRAVTKQDVRAEMAARRPGDPAQLVASSTRARELLDWQPRYPRLEDIVETAWKWHRQHFS